MLEGVLDDILAAKGPVGCGLAKWIDTLDPDDQRRVNELLAHVDVSADEVVAALAKHVKVGATSVRRHRRFLRGETSGCGCV